MSAARIHAASQHVRVGDLSQDALDALADLIDIIGDCVGEHERAGLSGLGLPYAEIAMGIADTILDDDGTDELAQRLLEAHRDEVAS